MSGSPTRSRRASPSSPRALISPFTYPGSKIVDVEISCAANEIAKLTVTVDSQTEVTGTAYAAPTFPTPDVFDFAGVTSNLSSVLLGGTLGGRLT